MSEKQQSKSEGFEQGDHWYNKSKTPFGRQTVNGLPDWVRSIGDPRLIFERGWEEDKIKFNGRIEVGWYFHPEWVTFLFRDRSIPAGEAYSAFAHSLTDPHINARGKHGGPTFRVHNNRDLDIVKQFLLARLPVTRAG